MNVAIEEWMRLCRYVDRFGLLESLVQFQHYRLSNESQVLSHALIPSDYLTFVQQIGLPTFHVDDDLFLHFFTLEEIERHSLYTSYNLPFATCDLDHKITLVFQQRGQKIEVVSYEDGHQIGIEGAFFDWMKKSVSHFLLQMSNYNFTDHVCNKRLQRGK